MHEICIKERMQINHYNIFVLHGQFYWDNGNFFFLVEINTPDEYSLGNERALQPGSVVKETII